MLPIPYQPASFVLDAAVFWTVYVVWFVSELVNGVRLRSGSNAQAIDRLSLRLLLASINVGLFAAFWLAGALPAAAIGGNQTIVFWCGVATMVAGLALRRFAIVTLGRFFTFDVNVVADQRVVERGLYRYMRHPGYTGAILTMLGVGIALTNWASIAALALAAAIGYGRRIQVEEAALNERLGDAYRTYAGHTKRLIPFVF